MKKDTFSSLSRQLDWNIILVPLAVILLLCGLFVAFPSASSLAIEAVRGFLGNQLGIFYIVIGLVTLFVSLYIAFSRYGNIRLGQDARPAHSNFRWGAMIFTSTMAADILFYSLCEWALYFNEPHLASMGGEVYEWAATYPLFHWGPIPWSFYIVLAAAFGFMLHVRGRTKQKFSEACRPLLGRRIDGFWGKAIDFFAVFALLCGVATTFSLSTPLLSAATGELLGIPAGIGLTLGLLAFIAVVYTLTVWFGLKGISRLASICTSLFLTLLAYVLLAGGEPLFILESGVTAIGKLVQNFLGMASWMDPLRVSGDGSSGFVQNWTVFYWAYWMVWCVATPFFIGIISRGRTLRNTVLGGYAWGLAGTFTSFIVLGGYGLAQQMKHGLDTAGALEAGGDLAQSILAILETLPLHTLGLILLAVTMIAFYATTFDALTHVVASYSYRELPSGADPDKRIRAYWAVLFILLPMALIFSESSMSNLQSVSIIGAFPMGIILLIIVASFFTDARRYLSEGKSRERD